MGRGRYEQGKDEVREAVRGRGRNGGVMQARVRIKFHQN